VARTGEGALALEQAFKSLRSHYRCLLDTLKSGVITLDANDIVDGFNEAALDLWHLSGPGLAGKRLLNTQLVHRCPELAAKVDALRGTQSEPITFKHRIKTAGEERLLLLTLRPILSDSSGERLGTLLHTEDITSREELRTAAEQLEATTEALQSANEELQTANEELRSTNERLEATNGEFESLNKELTNIKEKFEDRTRKAVPTLVAPRR
jgi:PAS domain S-box-containing protein